MTFSDAELSFAHSAGAFLMMGLNGVFAVIAALGGIIFVLVVVGTVLFGKKITGGHKLTFPLHAGGGAAASRYGSEGTVKLPGTAILVGLFFVSFVLYYFINWKYLSELWLFR
jgi:cytochrome c oxidase subunit 1